MTDIRACGFTEFGNPSVLRVLTVPMPEPGPGQVRVRVAAATVNPQVYAKRFARDFPAAASRTRRRFAR